MLGADDVARMVLALDAGEEHDEVRFTVVHAVEAQELEPYLLGIVSALQKQPGSRWARIMVGRLANERSLWPKARSTLARHDDRGLRLQVISTLRAVAAETGKPRLESLADALR